jgi:hypothetical protein
MLSKTRESHINFKKEKVFSLGHHFFLNRSMLSVTLHYIYFYHYSFNNIFCLKINLLRVIKYFKTFICNFVTFKNEGSWQN